MNDVRRQHFLQREVINSNLNFSLILEKRQFFTVLWKKEAIMSQSTLKKKA